MFGYIEDMGDMDLPGMGALTPGQVFASQGDQRYDPVTGEQVPAKDQSGGGATSVTYVTPFPTFSPSGPTTSPVARPLTTVAPLVLPPTPITYAGTTAPTSKPPAQSTTSQQLAALNNQWKAAYNKYNQLSGAGKASYLKQLQSIEYQISSMGGRVPARPKDPSELPKPVTATKSVQTVSPVNPVVAYESTPAYAADMAAQMKREEDARIAALEKSYADAKKKAEAQAELDWKAAESAKAITQGVQPFEYQGSVNVMYVSPKPSETIGTGVPITSTTDYYGESEKAYQELQKAKDEKAQREAEESVMQISTTFDAPAVHSWMLPDPTEPAVTAKPSRSFWESLASGASEAAQSIKQSAVKTATPFIVAGIKKSISDELNRYAGIAKRVPDAAKKAVSTAIQKHVSIARAPSFNFFGGMMDAGVGFGKDAFIRPMVKLAVTGGAEYSILNERDPARQLAKAKNLGGGIYGAGLSAIVRNMTTGDIDSVIELAEEELPGSSPYVVNRLIPQLKAINVRKNEAINPVNSPQQQLDSGVDMARRIAALKTEIVDEAVKLSLASPPTKEKQAANQKAIIAKRLEQAQKQLASTEQAYKEAMRSPDGDVAAEERFRAAKRNVQQLESQLKKLR